MYNYLPTALPGLIFGTESGPKIEDHLPSKYLISRDLNLKFHINMKFEMITHDFDENHTKSQIDH